MEHLTNEEIVRYAHITKLDEESLALSAKVTKHITVCGECLTKVRNALAVCDALEAICSFEDANIHDFVFDIPESELAAEVEDILWDTNEAEGSLNK